MHNNGKIVNCIPFTNEISPTTLSLLKEQVVMCLDSWKIFCRKYAENLAVTKNCVISLSLSGAAR